MATHPSAKNLPPAACSECKAPINPHAANYRGVRLCGSCAARRREATTPRASGFDVTPGLAQRASRRRHERSAEARELAERYRAEHPELFSASGGPAVGESSA